MQLKANLMVMFMGLGIKDGISQGAITQGVIIIIHEEVSSFVAMFPNWKKKKLF